MGSSNKYSPEVRERAVRMVLEHQGDHESQWAAIESIVEKIGCTSETLRKWVRQGECDQGRRAGVTSAERERWSGRPLSHGVTLRQGENACGVRSGDKGNVHEQR